jgi:hypothetical protein
MSFEANGFFLVYADHQQGIRDQFRVFNRLHRSRTVVRVRWRRLYRDVKATFLDRRYMRIFLALVFVLIPGASLSLAQSGPANLPIEFNIPAQPLSSALMTYGEASGFEVIYKTSLAEHVRSGEVIGLLTPSDALRILLDGTGYAAKTIDQGVFTIVEASADTIDPLRMPDVARRRRLEPYFAKIQPPISKVLCQKHAMAHETVVQFWLGSNGVIARAEVLKDNGESAADQTPAAPLLGMQVAAPPSNMPQPVTMIIFPAADAAKTCRTDQPQHRAG